MVRRALNSIYAPSWAHGPWYGAVMESFTGAWQTNTVVAPTTTILSCSAVFACVTGIASDIAKMRIKLSRNDDGIWEEITANQPWLPLLREPNHFQNRIQFVESWMISKLLYGNAYILKRRDGRGVVNRLYVLHPNCVKPLVTETGDVYYELKRDDLSKTFDLQSVTDEFWVIPASEMIHDRMNTLWHPLIGVSPLYACGNSATMGNAIQTNATKFFQNLSRPGGMLSAPGEISDETAARLKTYFESNFGGDNIGKIAVAGDGLKYEAFGIDAQKSQQVEQMAEVVKDVARAFRYPLWKLGGPNSPYTKPDQAQTSYYTDCLQSHIEQIELALDNGLELPVNIGTEFDLDGLMRMDTQALYESNNAAKGWMTPDEQRFRANLRRLPDGGDTVYLQHQDYPIEIIANRQDLDAPATPPPASAEMPDEMPEEMPDEMPAERGFHPEHFDLLLLKLSREEAMRQNA